ncbi:GLE1-domain-containing protein [Rozella allomycis CSF55]|uniref:mRNA export factor GLE1 n=1 Tax=Rozella allomycis (strain CSF55) TaxID=988480 RepID=A0A4P9YQW6_ROZAC|nr:GLE1-domain-containing protein [Rozella allomycis CSF55]
MESDSIPKSLVSPRKKYTSNSSLQTKTIKFSAPETFDDSTDSDHQETDEECAFDIIKSKQIEKTKEIKSHISLIKEVALKSKEKAEVFTNLHRINPEERENHSSVELKKKDNFNNFFDQFRDMSLAVKDLKNKFLDEKRRENLQREKEIQERKRIEDEKKRLEELSRQEEARIKLEKDRVEKELLMKEQEQEQERQQKIMLENKLKQEKMERIKMERTKMEEEKQRAVIPIPETEISETIQGEINDLEAIYNKMIQIRDDQTDKNFKSEIKIQLNTKVGQISSIATQVQSVVNDLQKTLNNAKSKGENLYQYALFILGEKITEQATFQIAINPASAFPTAIVVHLLYKQHENIINIIAACLYRCCPYIIPIYHKKLKNMSIDDFRLLVGYVKKDGAFESEESYQERMSGVIALYAAILQHDFKGNRPIGIERAWAWLARMLNSKPRRISPVLLLSFLNIAGFQFFKHFPNQFPKIIAYIEKEYLPLIPKESVAAKTRLSLWIQEYREKKKITKPEGFTLVR